MKAILCIVYIAFANTAAAYIQRVAASGQLTCVGQPAGGVKIKLYDGDTYSFDNQLGATATYLSNGNFTVDGAENSDVPMNPKINVYHNCFFLKSSCTQRFTIDIPPSCITDGEKKVFDIGILKLEDNFPGQIEDCTTNTK